MPGIVFLNLLNDHLFCVIIHLPDEFVAEMKGPVLNPHLANAVKKHLLGSFDIFSVNMI